MFFLLISLRTYSHSLNDVNSLHCIRWFLLYYLLCLFSSDCFAALTSLYFHKFFIWIYEFFKNHLRRRLSRNVNLSNLENVLQRNLKTDMARDCIFRASGGTNFENLPHWRYQPWWIAEVDLGLLSFSATIAAVLDPPMDRKIYLR